MPRPSSLTREQRERAVDRFEQGWTVGAAATEIGSPQRGRAIYFSVYNLHQVWQVRGRMCLMDRTGKTRPRYSLATKKQVVERYIAGEAAAELAREFNLSSRAMVHTWAKQWRDGGDQALAPKKPGRTSKRAPAEPATTTEKSQGEDLCLLRAENAYLRQLRGVETVTSGVKAQVITALRSEYRLLDLLRVSGVARSTYYYHLSKQDAPDRHEGLQEQIREVFEASRRRYGHRRVRLVLVNEYQTVVSRKLVARLMRKMGLVCKARRRRGYSSYQGQVGRVAGNVLNREFEATKPSQKWVSDVTMFHVAGKKMYLCPVMDLCDRSILSYRVSASPDTRLTREALESAIREYQPAPGVVVHTDQGVQYQHRSWQALITGCGGVVSMSRKGNCYDNSVMENFFGHLKSEMFYGEQFESVEVFCRAVDEYICWWNTVRVQERLGGLSPAGYRRQLLLAA